MKYEKNQINNSLKLYHNSSFKLLTKNNNRIYNIVM